MKTVVTGASGMLGSAVLRELLNREEVAAGWSKTVHSTPDGVELLRVDLTDMDRAARFLGYYCPELIVHCAAMTDADACELDPKVARLVNSYVPEGLARIAQETEIRFVHVSTDAVYDGSLPGRRRETEQTRPGSVYARTKLEGEGRVLAAYPEALVVRTTMFGWTLPTAPRPKFAEEILGALTSRRQIKLWSDAFFSPLFVNDLAETLLDLADLDVSGVLNVGARRPVSKAEFGHLLASTFGLDNAYIREASVDDAGLTAARPKNVGLDVRGLTSTLGTPPLVSMGLSRLYDEAFDGTARKIRGRERYP